MRWTFEYCAVHASCHAAGWSESPSSKENRELTTFNSQGLPLGEAIRAFCDADLVTAWAAACAEERPPIPPGTMFHDEARRVVREERARIDGTREITLRHVIDDLRARVAAGELIITGLQFRPQLAPTRCRIPRDWASIFTLRSGIEFWIVETILTAGEFAFRNLRIHRARRVEAAVERVEALPLPVAPPASSSVRLGASMPSARGRGRISHLHLVEEDLRANWPEVERQARSSGGRPTWSELARSVYRRLERTQRGRSIPQEETIRTRLPEIYARLLSEKRVRK